ncbi:MAG TPA: hypothetical protein VLI39_03880, partial [Sedimentisphaerales bacterium]|nr:hypothetical protein [Sedimentisphaerales bacterium]
TVYRENAGDIVLWPRHGLPIEPKPDEEAVILGQVVMTDFARAQVLDRLLVHERRIENSLYRTMRELRREQEARTAAEASHSQADREVNKVNEVNEVLTPHSKGGLAVDREPAIPAELASFGADCTDSSPRGSDKRSLRSLSMVPSQGQDHRQTSLSLPPGVEASRSDFTLENSHLKLAKPSCETNPIAGEASRVKRQVSRA